MIGKFQYSTICYFFHSLNEFIHLLPPLQHCTGKVIILWCDPMSVNYEAMLSWLLWVIPFIHMDMISIIRLVHVTSRYRIVRPISCDLFFMYYYIAQEKMQTNPKFKCILKAIYVYERLFIYFLTFLTKKKPKYVYFILHKHIKKNIKYETKNLILSLWMSRFYY